MSAGELFFRIAQSGQKIREKIFSRVPLFENVFIKEVTNNFRFNLFENVNTSTCNIFGKAVLVTGSIDFHLDVFSEKKFPLIFSKSIDIRSDRYGSAKVVWEINRLQFLIPIVLKYKATGDIKYLNRFVSILSSWDNQNPYMKGVNWYSNIEVNIRLINWYWCWLILHGDDAWMNRDEYRKFKNEVWLPLIYKHCYYSYNNPSYFSSANNHLISEYAGLFIASTLWEFPESKKWLEKSKLGLEKEISQQHSENGINREEAAEYIQFITDFFILAFVAGEQQNIKFSSGFIKMLENICVYINNFLDAKNNFPKYGDEDDGRVISVDGDVHSNNFTSILNTSAVLLNTNKFKRAGVEWDLKSELLTSFKRGHDLWLSYSTSPIPQDSIFYKKEGHFFFRKVEKAGSEIYCHFDAAPLGFLSIAAHGHADALSIAISLDGYPFLVDPGTYTYHTHKEWRKYFVSTLAHNTISVNGENQALLAGPTLWVDHFKATVLSADSSLQKDSVSAEHNGYHKSGVIHKRTVDFDKIENIISVSDVITATGSRQYQLFMPFHFHPDVLVLQGDKNCFVLSRKETDMKLKIITDSKLDAKIISASENGYLGWYSPSFMIKQSSTSVMCESSFDDKQIFLSTVIKIGI